jgi:hypothetical protein
MNKAIIEATQDLIEVAMNAKAAGHDVFVSFQAHIQQVEVRVYLNGWDREKVFAAKGSGADYQVRINLEGILAPQCPAATIREAGVSIIELIEATENK